MKKIFLFILILISLKGFSQYPVNTAVGSTSQLQYQNGAYGARLGYVFKDSFGDTTAANLSFIKNVPGQVIRVGNTLWMRNTALTTWIQIGSADLSGYLLKADSSVNGGYYPYATNPKSYLTKGDSTAYATFLRLYKVRDSLVNAYTAAIAAIGTPTLQQVLTAGNTTTLDYHLINGSSQDYVTITQSGGAGKVTAWNPSINYSTRLGYIDVTFFNGTNSGSINFSTNSLTGNRTWAMPDSTGTVPLAIYVNGTRYNSNEKGTIDLGTIGGGTTYTFTAADFNESGTTISIDYTNGQAANTSTKGFLTSTDWNTFNDKVSYTDAAARAAISLTTTGTGASTYNNSTGVLNIPDYSTIGGAWNGLFATSNIYPGTTSIAPGAGHTWTGGTGSLTLPAISAAGNRNLFVKNMGTGTVTMQRAGSDVIYTDQDLTDYDLAPGESALFTIMNGKWAVLYQGLATDATPTNGSTNPVQSDGVFDALALKASAFTETVQEYTSSTSSVKTLSNTPISGSVQADVNGIIYRSSNVSVVGTTVTLSGLTLETSDIVTIRYRY